MAELTLQRLTDRMARFMGWDSTDWPSEIPPSAIANEAGRDLYNACEWNHLQRPPVTLDVVLGQEYITLPDDFGSCAETDITATTFGAYSLLLRTMPQVVDARTILGTPSTGSWVGAIVFADPAGAPTMPRARIEIGPVPTADADAAFTLSYRAGWVDVTNPGDICFVPPFFEPLYIRAACLWLAGYEKDRQGSLEDRMDRLQQSSLWMNAISQDANTQQGVGITMNTAADVVDDGWIPAGLPISKTQTFV